MIVFTINRTVGDWNVWFTPAGKWSNEWPDARKYKTRFAAERDLKVIKRSNDWFADASVDQTEIEDSYQ